MVSTKYVESTDVKGKKAEQILSILEELDKSDTPVPFEQLCSNAKIKYPQDIQVAMTALEIAQVVKKYQYVEQGGTRRKAAYALNVKESSGNPS